MKINFIGDKKIISQFNEFLLNQNNFEIIDNLVEKISKVNFENFIIGWGLFHLEINTLRISMTI